MLFASILLFFVTNFVYLHNCCFYQNLVLVISGCGLCVKFAWCSIIPVNVKGNPKAEIETGRKIERRIVTRTESAIGKEKDLGTGKGTVIAITEIGVTEENAVEKKMIMIVIVIAGIVTGEKLRQFSFVYFYNKKISTVPKKKKNSSYSSNATSC